MVLLAGLARAQGARPAYEVASVKVNNSGSGNTSSNGSKGQVVMTNQPMQRLLERAFGVKPMQVSGPGWIQDERYDIVAKYPEETKNEDRVLMLRTLLEDRFKLAVHRETKEIQGFALVVAKSGFKLKPAKAEDGSSTNSSGGRVRKLTAQRTSMVQLAELLTRYLGELVVDRTGIEGVYDFEFQWVNDDQPPSPETEGVPSLFDAVQETLGLKLQRQRVPTEMIVVDHLERMPVEN